MPDHRLHRVLDAMKTPWYPVADQLAALRAESLRHRASHWETPNVPLHKMAARDIEHGSQVLLRGTRIVLGAVTESLAQMDREMHGKSPTSPPNDPRWTAEYWGQQNKPD